MASRKKLPDGEPATRVDAGLPVETQALRHSLTQFLRTEWTDPVSSTTRKIRTYRWGVYAFYDYDGEPIYIGQTSESLGTRIRRHLTNQRTDAVAMSVLDPFEVAEIEVWALPEFQRVKKKDGEAQQHLNALEFMVFNSAKEKVSSRRC